MNLYKFSLILIISFILHGCKTKPQLGSNYEPGRLDRSRAVEEHSVLAHKSDVKRSGKNLHERQDRKKGELLSLKPEIIPSSLKRFENSSGVYWAKVAANSASAAALLADGDTGLEAVFAFSNCVSKVSKANVRYSGLL